MSTNHTSSPGNPFARQTAALRQALLDAVTAARLVLSYVLGKPGPAVNPDRLDADEWQGYKETAGMVQEMPAMLQTPAPALPLEAVRSTRPVLTREMARQLGDMLAHPEKYEEEIPDLELVDERPSGRRNRVGTVLVTRVEDPDAAEDARADAATQIVAEGANAS